MPPEKFSIAQVTPYAWEEHHEVNRYVERLSDELCQRGHRVVVITPSESRKLVRDSRATIKRCAEDPECVFASDGCAQVLAVGQSVLGRRGGSVSLPIDVSRTIESVLESAPFDFVHVHEPFAPSASSAALRHSRALNVGTFHAATERVLSTQVARRFVELFFGRLDARTASFRATRDLICRHFPGDYEVVLPGADLVERPTSGDREMIDIFFSAEEERSSLRVFLRALRRLPAQLPWHATIWSRLPNDLGTLTLPRALRERVTLAGPADGSEAQPLARAQIAVAASTGTAPAPQYVLRALAGGAVPVAARLPEYEEALDDGERGLLFEPRDVETLAAQLYRRVAARRHETNGKTNVRKRLASREHIHVDLHMHTDHSHDCATPVDVLLESAKTAGLGAIAITDHNEISGALEAADRANGIKVIVSEEVKTADQGEVIGLFIKEKIERGMTLDETIAEIRRQGGLVYVPHPFDRMHAVPDYEHMLDIVEEIDAIEVFNPRVAISSFNEEAARFAAKYRIVAGAGP